MSQDGRTFYYLWRDNDDDGDDGHGGYYREFPPHAAILSVFEDRECCKPTKSERAALRAALRRARVRTT